LIENTVKIVSKLIYTGECVSSALH